MGSAVARFARKTSDPANIVATRAKPESRCSVTEASVTAARRFSVFRPITAALLPITCRVDVVPFVGSILPTLNNLTTTQPYRSANELKTKLRDEEANGP